MFFRKVVDFSSFCVLYVGYIYKILKKKIHTYLQKSEDTQNNCNNLKCNIQAAVSPHNALIQFLLQL